MGSECRDKKTRTVLELSWNITKLVMITPYSPGFVLQNGEFNPERLF